MNTNSSSASAMPCVLITGSSGLIGQRVAAALADTYRVVGFDLEPSDSDDIKLDWNQCDMTDEQSVISSLEKLQSEHGSRLASVIHLAAHYDFSGEPSPLYRELTVEGTQRLLRHLQEFDVEQFTFASTLLVMRSAEDDRPIDAFSPVDAQWDYPKSKLAAESVIRQERGKIPAIILRMAGAYDEDCHAVPIAQQVSRIHQKQLESYFFPGDKSHGQAFIHLDDLIACIERLIERRHELAPYDVFVVGEEDIMSYDELQDELGQLIHGSEWPTLRIPKIAAKAGAWAKEKLAGDDDENAPFIKPWMIDLADQNFPVSVERSRTALGWEPQHSLRRTLPEIVRRLHNDPQRWYQVNGLPVPKDIAARGSDEARRS